MYGIGNYGKIHYARDHDKNGEKQENFVNLGRYVPNYVAELHEMAEIYRTEGYEIGNAKYAFKDLLKQCFVQTATWGLVRWEKEYGIKTNYALPYEQRREIIMAKMRGQGTTTVEMIRNAAMAFSGGEVEVIEDNANYHFIVRFIGQKGIPRNMQAFKEMLEEIKPAHLEYSFEYRFVVWTELEAYKWTDVGAETWRSIRSKDFSGGLQ